MEPTYDMKPKETQAAVGGTKDKTKLSQKSTSDELTLDTNDIDGKLEGNRPSSASAREACGRLANAVKDLLKDPGRAARWFRNRLI